MKSLMISTIAILIFLSSGMLYSSKLSSYQVADVFICEEGIVLAEMTAKTLLSRRELTTVSYCTCEGVDQSFKTGVTKNKCEPPKDMVYSCTCVGKTHY
ncbi:MAG TPA: hypothetical protein PLA65_15600 [Spirochaetota bacterium]|nr:hypothetical protein [Spirochaetota bacterium]HPG49633.1 hypothetical protein [Spirochaetota bacterium]HPN13483.1 hypothetical protein [Spirochaetota bacterium]